MGDTPRREITVRAIDRTSVRAQRIIAEILPSVIVTKTLRVETFPATPDQAAQVRRVVKETLGEEPALDTVVLLASELAANAVRHSRSEFFALVIARTGDLALRVAIVDEGRCGFPSLHEESPDGETGRGLLTLDRMAARWGITRRRGIGAAIWFDTI
jgi:anti-sigma regulatory factor (Ser/Thr protein kinase)